MSEKERLDAVVTLIPNSFRWLYETPDATVHAFRVWVEQSAVVNRPFNKDWERQRVIAARRCADQIYAMYRNLHPDRIPEVDDKAHV